MSLPTDDHAPAPVPSASCGRMARGAVNCASRLPVLGWRPSYGRLVRGGGQHHFVTRYAVFRRFRKQGRRQVRVLQGTAQNQIGRVSTYAITLAFQAGNKKRKLFIIKNLRRWSGRWESNRSGGLLKKSKIAFLLGFFEICHHRQPIRCTQVVHIHPAFTWLFPRSAYSFDTQYEHT